MEKEYTSPSIEKIEIQTEGTMSNSNDSPANGYSNNSLEDLE
ncbi:MAG: hypothetical protein ACI4TM_01245 [Candidatus Cryptobacteroides sp.]